MSACVIKSSDLHILLLKKKKKKLLQSLQDIWFLQWQAFLGNQTHAVKIQTPPNFFVSIDMIVDAVRQICYVWTLDEWIQVFTSTHAFTNVPYKSLQIL